MSSTWIPALSPPLTTLRMKSECRGFEEESDLARVAQAVLADEKRVAAGVRLKPQPGVEHAVEDHRRTLDVAQGDPGVKSRRRDARARQRAHHVVGDSSAFGGFEPDARALGRRRLAGVQEAGRVAVDVDVVAEGHRDPEVLEVDDAVPGDHAAGALVDADAGVVAAGAEGVAAGTPGGWRGCACRANPRR